MVREVLSRRTGITDFMPEQQAQPATQAEFFTHVSDTWQAMYRDCAAAKISIIFEQYLVENDAVGQRFLELFRNKARQGVHVWLLLDGVGSRSVRNSPLIEEIRQAGGFIDFYNPLTWKQLFNPKRWLPRDHCKILIIDSQIAYIGGVCLNAKMNDWHDLHMRMTGALPGIIPPSSEHYEEGMRYESGGLEYVVSRSRHEAHIIYRQLLEQIETAGESICLVTPYFFPPRRMRKALARAARRGVHVRIIISAATDIPFGTFISRSYFPSMFRRGAHILVYSKAVIHAKYAIIDDDWATMGSTNFDYLSLVRNQEANIVICDKKVIADLAHIFETDAALSALAPRRHGLWQVIFRPLIAWIRQRL